MRDVCACAHGNAHTRRAHTKHIVSRRDCLPVFLLFGISLPLPVVVVGTRARSSPSVLTQPLRMASLHALAVAAWHVPRAPILAMYEGHWERMFSADNVFQWALALWPGALRGYPLRVRGGGA